MKITQAHLKWLMSTNLSGLAKSVLLALMQEDQSIAMLSKRLEVSGERIREALKELAMNGLIKMPRFVSKAPRKSERHAVKPD